jgi:hypothetical protein
VARKKALRVHRKSVNTFLPTAERYFFMLVPDLPGVCLDGDPGGQKPEEV